jgi:hypothetical protein
LKGEREVGTSKRVEQMMGGGILMAERREKRYTDSKLKYKTPY